MTNTNLPGPTLILLLALPF